MSSIDSFTEAVRESLNAGEYSHLPTAEEEEARGETLTYYWKDGV